MQNYNSPGRILDAQVAPAGGVTSGTPVMIGGMLMVPQADASVGVAFAGAIDGVFTLAKETGTAWTSNQVLYWDDDNSRCTHQRIGRAIGTAEGATASGGATGLVRLEPAAGLRLRDGVVNVIDDDSAASNGTAVYVVLTDGPAYLCSVTAGNATTSVNIDEDDDAILVVDSDDAATIGVQLYFDEDADSDARLLINSPLALPVYLPTMGGRLIRIGHNATPGTPGVAVYVDDDGATASEKLLFVSPTNADGAAYARGGL